MARAVATGAVPPDRLVGSAPHAMSAAARALIALEADGSPSSVHVGVTAGDAPPVRVDWDRSAIDGVPAEQALRREQQGRLDARLAALWPLAPLTLGAWLPSAL